MDVVGQLKKCSGNVTFTQATVDQCTVIHGNLIFTPGSDNVTEVDISRVQEIKGNLIFSNVVSSSVLNLSQFPGMTFASLERIGGSLKIENNTGLLFFVIKDTLSEIAGDVIVRNNSTLAAVELSRLERLGGSLVFENNPEYLGLQSFAFLESIGGDLKVINAPKFGPLRFYVPAVTYVGGVIDFTGTPYDEAEMEQLLTNIGRN